jgi:hypothetical protein
VRGVLAGSIDRVGPKRLWFWLGPDWILVPRHLDLPAIRTGAEVVVVFEQRRGLLWAVRVRPQPRRRIRSQPLA